MLIVGLNCQVYGSEFFDQIAEAINNPEKDLISSIAPNEPLYIPLTIIKNLKENHKSKQEIIKELETLLVSKDFEVKLKQIFEKDKHALPIDNIRSFRIWRESLYLILARAYYSEGEYKRAIYYYQGIPPSSFIAPVAFVELGWSYLYDKNLVEGNKLITVIEKELQSEMTIALQSEFKLLQNFYMLKNMDYEKAIKFSSRYDVSRSFELDQLHKKVVAQAYFDQFLYEANDWKASLKMKKLKNIIKEVETIDPTARDAKISFLAAETYWHLASVYRLEDPLKFKKEWSANLDKGYSWISPWVDKSIGHKKAYLDEEAMFFAFSLLWEQEKFELAIEKMKYHPILFPQGEYLADIYQLLGDHYFDKNDFNHAIEYYRHLATEGQETKSVYGVYKAAWSFFNLGKKWNALRHFERLFLHNIKLDMADPLVLEKLRASGLQKEIRNDLIVVMIDLLDYKKIVQEIAMFNLPDEDSVLFQSDVADAFQNSGKFNEAVVGWKSLLDGHGQNNKKGYWILQLARAELGQANKIEISRHLDKYLGLLSESEKYADGFIRELGNILLTVHKEAVKSDNAKDWKAVDSLYPVYDKYFPKSVHGEVWFFGAQRKEALQKKWEAISWYKRAAKIPKYENYLDAADSVLRIINDVNNDLSIIEKIGETELAEYKRISQEALWYVENFYDTKARVLAEFVYFEALYKLGDRLTIFDYVVQNFKKYGDSAESWNQFVEVNRWLYRDKGWADLNGLVERIFNLKIKTSNEHNLTFSKIFYESAFQHAFLLEEKLKANKNSDGKASENKKFGQEAVTWYKKATRPLDQIGLDREIALKSWHNALVLLSEQKLSAQFMEELANFKKDFVVGDIASDMDSRLLLYNIMASASFVFKEQDDMLEYANHLRAASEYTDDVNIKSNMIWDYSVIYASYYLRNQFEDGLLELAKVNNAILSAPQSVITLTKIYLNFAQYDKSLELILSYLAENAPTNEIILLLRDIFFLSGRDNQEDKAFLRVTKYLKDNETKLRDNILLREIWAEIYNKEGMADFVKLEDTPATLLLLELSKKQKKEIQADSTLSEQERADHLKKRVEEVGTVLKELMAVKEIIQTHIIEWQPQLAVSYICQAPLKTENAILALAQIKAAPIASSQWPEFVSKIDGKIVELTQAKQEESALCQQYESSFAMMRKVDKPFCAGKLCIGGRIEVEGAFKSIMEIEKKSKSVDERIMQLISHADYLRAEYLISGLEDKNRKGLYLAIMRFAIGDSWNSSLLLRKYIETKILVNQSKLYYALLLANKGEIENAKALYNEIDRTALSGYDLALFKKLF